MPLEDIGNKPLTFDTILDTDAEELNRMLARDFYTPIPVSISSADEMMSAGKLLAKITNSYSYLMVLFAETDARVRVLKKDKDKKEEYTDLIGKRNALEAYIDILKQSYAGLSREISTRQEALREINMSRSTT